MSKIYAFIVIIPFVALLLFKGIAFYEYDTKERYLKDLVDNTAYKVKITGILTYGEYDELKAQINTLANFDSHMAGEGVILKKGTYVDGNIVGMTGYTPGEQLYKGDAFLIYIKSTNVSNYSRIQNGGISPDDTQNIYYKAKALCRVEYNER